MAKAASDGFAYSHDGMAMRAVDARWELADGEILFADYATPEDLTKAFPGYAAAVAAEQLAGVRIERNARIAATDWTQLPDNGLSDQQRAAWATYRQVLRDVTADPAAATGIEAVAWPQPPIPSKA